MHLYIFWRFVQNDRQIFNINHNSLFKGIEIAVQSNLSNCINNVLLHRNSTLRMSIRIVASHFF